MKGLLLAGGTGSRLRPLTFTGAKQLIPVANRPILFYVVEAMVAAGVKDIGVIVGETASLIQDALGDGEKFGCHFTYILQDRPLGLADAVRTAQPFLKDAAFLMMLGDNLLRGGLTDLVQKFSRHPSAAQLLLTEVAHPEAFGVAVLDGDRVVKLMEKPVHPPSPWALVGAYCFDPVIHTAIAQLKPSARGEYEITDAIQNLIDRNLPVEASFVTGWWKDTGRPEDVLEANRLVLADISSKIEGDVDEYSVVDGPVVIGAGAIVRHSVLRGPAVIGHGAHIERSYIGPYTAVGDGVQVLHTDVENSVVLADSILDRVPMRIDQSLIGRGVRINVSEDRPRALRVV
ncbi:MAG: glucose-1-phosphate thymidylyltransferase, partial [Firmicutes bacterium]|nr:glucose-1-phosphate thymidylyltransferase [Bacillota bacterium]